MRKIKALILAIALSFAGTSVYAQGYPVIDMANLLESIEAVWQYYQQIQQTIEQVQNTYKRIEQAAKQVQKINFDDLSDLGKNFSGMGDNPFEIINGVHSSAQDITKSVNKQMNKINDLQDSLNKESISFGGMKVSVADLVGAGDPDKTMFGFVQNAWDYSTDKENGAFSDAIRGWEGKLTYKERQKIVKKYGMSPRNYGTIQYANVQLNDLVIESGILATEQGQKQTLTEIEEENAALKTMGENLPEDSIYAEIQMSNSTLAQLDRNLGNLHNTLNRGIGLVAAKIKSDKTEEAVKQQDDFERKASTELNSSGSAMAENDDM